MVVHPLTLVDISVGLDKFTVPPRAVFLPFAFVFRLVWPNLHPYAFSQIVHNTTFVDCSIFEPDYFPAAGAGGGELTDGFSVFKSACFVQFMVAMGFRYGRE